MNARNSRSVKASTASAGHAADRSEQDADLAFDDLLDARFDAEGRLAQIGQGARQRVAEHLQARPPATSAEELERAVRKLAEGLDAIERQSRSATPETRIASSAAAAAEVGSDRDIVTHGLDRLEARLEALSQRLQGGETTADDDGREEAGPASSHEEPSLASGADEAAGRAELRRLAEMEAEHAARHVQMIAEAHQREAEAEAEAAEAMRIAEAQAEARRRAEEEAAESMQRAAEHQADADRRVEEAEEEMRRQAATAEAERHARIEEARRGLETATQMQNQLAAIEARVDALQEDLDDNQIEPVRAELMQLLNEIQGLAHSRNSTASALEAIDARLGEMELKVNAARNMAGNRLGDIQDRLVGLTDRLDTVEVEIPAYDAIRENQGAILERFDRMEGLVHHLASPEEIQDRIDGLRRQLQNTASQEDVSHLGDRLFSLADRLDALPEALSDQAALEKIEDQLATVASDLKAAREQRLMASANLEHRLSELSGQLIEVAEAGRSVDVSALEAHLAAFDSRLLDDQTASRDAFLRLERRLTDLATTIEEKEDAAELLAGLTRKVDSLAEAIEAQDTDGARRDVGALGDKLDNLGQQIVEHTEYLSRAQIQPLESRLEEMQRQLDELNHQAAQSSEQLRPFAQKLQDISERVSTLGAADEHSPLSLRLEAIEERIVALGNSGKGPDARALQTQLEGIISRLELLKGRSIDPARLNELFDRVDATIRALPDDRFDRLEQRLADTATITERFEQLEQTLVRSANVDIEDQLARLESRIADAGMSQHDIERLANRVAESAASALAEQTPAGSDERIARLERKLETIGLATSVDGSSLSVDAVAELQEDILSLRRELRSLPGLGQDEAGFGDLLRTIVSRMDQISDRPAASTAALEAQMERIAGLLDDPGQSRLALAHVESSLKTIEERLDETRRAVTDHQATTEQGDGEATAMAGVARALSDDVEALRSSTKASEKSTKDALDAVQGTLEAVVKRMAFLERDADEADKPAASPEKATDTAKPDVFAQTDVTPKATTPAEAGALVERLERTKPDTADPDSGDAGSQTPVLTESGLEAAETPAGEAESAEQRSGSLLSRLTSRQLLRRATGGKAESFTPEPDESEDETDLPLEPGTDSPLNSALTGAPTSATGNLSGRDKGRETALGGDLGSADQADNVIDENFLVAARRAARAAADEASGVEPSAPVQSGGQTFKSRRVALMAAALAVAVAFAAFQIVRNQVDISSNVSSVIAAIPGFGSSAPTPASAPGVPPIEETVQAEALAEEMPAVEEPASEAPPTEMAALPEAATPEVEAELGTATTASAPTDTPAEEIISEPPSMAAATMDDAAALATMTTDTPTTTFTTEATPPEPPVTMVSQRLRDAAMSGNPAAGFEVAARFAEGSSGLRDMPAAVAWYESVAADGLAPAQYRLGSIYEKGLGVTKDMTKAQDWYRRAADAGNVKAMHNLAVLFAEGAGGEPDLEAAAQLFRRAAEHGVRDSQFNLAILHARGLGVPQDLIEAYKWFSIAATSGDEESAKRRDIIAAALPEETLSQAQAAAAGFQPVPLISEANEVLMPEGGWSDQRSSISVEAQPEKELGSTLSENDMVALVQKLLTEKGFNPGPTDGLLGQRTIEAILSFQGEAGLPKTGRIDPTLLDALKGTAG